MIIQEGHRLGIISAAKGVHFALHNAAWQEGFVLVPLPPDGPPGDLAEMLDTAAVDVVVADRRSASVAQAVHGGRPVLLCEDDGEPAGRVEGRLDPPRAPEGTFAVVRTSGTTGTPSWIEIPRASLEAHREAAMRRLGCREDSVWLHVVPMHHMAGIGIVDRCLHGGGRMVLHDTFDAEAAWHAMAKQGVSHVSLVPTMLRRLVGLDRGCPDSLECALVGGDSLDPVLASDAMAAGWPVYASYGLTESCGQVATARPEQLRAAPGTVGSPLDGVEVRIVAAGAGAATQAAGAGTAPRAYGEGDGDADGAALGPGEEGEIVVTGPSVCTGGPLATGDLGHLDEAGRLFVTGRLDDRITTGGKKVDPARVEAVLETHRAVAAACVVGVPDAQWGQRVVAVVEAEPGVLPDTRTLQDHCRAALERHEVPKDVRIDRVPRTETGKPVRAAVRRLWKT